MRTKSIITTLVSAVALSTAVSADTIEFRNGAVLQGHLLSSDETHVRFESDGTVGNYSRSDVKAIAISPSFETTLPPEPENLDMPTSWQDGDPLPEEMEVPAQEPEQRSEEAPPAQPIEDDVGDPPSQRHVWVTGYWWWRPVGYFWVPGYWTIPPHINYVYIPGYWHFAGGSWIYIRGGWGYPGSTAIIVYPMPRPFISVSVCPAPSRIIRRHVGWHHHHYRHAHHRAYYGNKNSRHPTGRRVVPNPRGNRVRSAEPVRVRRAVKPQPRPQLRRATTTRSGSSIGKPAKRIRPPAKVRNLPRSYRTKPQTLERRPIRRRPPAQVQPKIRKAPTVKTNKAVRPKATPPKRKIRQPTQGKSKPPLRKKSKSKPAQRIKPR
ncbi:MAG: YXWGXW repeat-containing protein [Myxococcota bacterium]|nr:YXWGXW repeat-containing protein [Myxococcota bacterium]